MAKFMVAGGAGFIGSNIVERLLKEGHSVRVVDNLCSGFLHNLDFAKDLPAEKFEFIEADIRDVEKIDQACKEADYVLLLAASKSVPKSMLDPESYNDVNINGVLNVLKACSKNKVKRLVLSSSSSVYGDSVVFPQKEEHHPKPISPYAITKLAGEHYCKIFAAYFNVETICLRYFNVFGPKQALDDEYSAVIPKFINCLFDGEQTPIFGNGLQSRDFTYVDNVVEANILAATTEGLKHEVLNTAMGKTQTVLDLVATLNKVMGTSIEPKFLPVREGDIFKSEADVSLAKEKLSFDPQIDFEEGLKRTVEFYRDLRK